MQEKRLPEDEDARRRELDEREFVRAAGEDDDLYDPYSDRPPEREALFERDPWS